MAPTLNFVCDKFPSQEGPRFIELEDSNGKSISYGTWRERTDGLVELAIPDHRELLSAALIQLDEIHNPDDDYLYELRASIRAALTASESDQ